MGFSDKQVRALSRSVPADAIRTRMSSGKELTFIEGWYAVAQANRIFGFDGWDRETVETKCLQAREARGTFTAIYSAKVRITVRTADAVVVREGHGTGEAQGGSPGEVQDRALKAAETDATKRALATFGKAFGLALYAGDQAAGAAARVEDRRLLAQARGARGEAKHRQRRRFRASDAEPPSAEVSVEANGAVRRAASAEPARLTASTRIEKNLLTFPEPQPGPGQGAPPLRRRPALPPVQRDAVGPAPRPLRPAAGDGAEGGGRLHGAALPEAPPRPPRQRQRGGLVARHGDRAARDRAGPLGGVVSSPSRASGSRTGPDQPKCNASDQAV